MMQHKSHSPETIQFLSAKQTMNFVRHKPSFDLRRVLPATVAAILALLVFVKIGLLDPLQQKALAYEALSQKQEQLAQLNTRLAGYEELQQQSLRYGTSLLRPEEAALASRGDVLTLVEEKIGDRAILQDFTVNLNILTIHICAVTLEAASTIVSDLESSPMVASAAIHSATADDGNQAQIFISVTLTDESREE